MSELKQRSDSDDVRGQNTLKDNELLQLIGKAISDINVVDMTKAERRIASLLIAADILRREDGKSGSVYRLKN